MSDPTRAIIAEINALGANAHQATWPTTGSLSLPCELRIDELLSFAVDGDAPGIRGSGTDIIEFLNNVGSAVFQYSNGVFVVFGTGFENFTYTSATGLASAERFQTQNGTNSAPAFSFLNDNISGVYLSGESIIGIALGGSDVGTLSPSGLLLSIPLGGNGLRQRVRTATTTDAVQTNDHTLLGNATGGAFDFDLPPASQVPEQIYVIKKIDASGNAVNIDPNGTETIDGSSSSIALTTQWSGRVIQSTGSAWVVIGTF